MILNACIAPLYFKRSTKGLTASQKAGYVFEKQVMRALAREAPDLHSAYSKNVPWIKYETRTGVHYAMPDGVIPSFGLVLECKLSRVVDGSAEAKLDSLYIPLAKIIWPEVLAWKSLIVVKYWKGPGAPLATSLRDATSPHNYMIWRS